MDRLLGLNELTSSEGSLTFISNPPAEVYLAVAIGLLVLGWLSYRRHRGGTAKPWLVLLTALRASALFLVFLTVLGPRWSSSVQVKGSLVVGVLVDASGSMDRSDPNLSLKQIQDIAVALGLARPGAQVSSEAAGKIVAMSRGEIARTVIERAGLVGDGNGDLAFRTRYFSRAVSEQPPVDPAEKDVTALGNALREMISDSSGRRLTAVVLFSDGGSNSGQDPVAAARFAAGQGVPIFAFGLGGEEPARDLALEPVDYRETIIKGDSLTVSCVAAMTGFGKRSVTVILKKGNEEIQRKTLELSPETPKAPVEFSAKLEQAGELSFSVEIPHEPEEALADNNVRSFRVRVVEDRIRVLYAAGAPSWEYRYLKHALMRDPTMECCVLLQRTDGWFHEGNHRITRFPADLSEFGEFDVVILQDIALPGYVPEGSIEALEQFVSDTSGGFIWVAGEFNGLGALTGTPLSRLLPVRINSSNASGQGVAEFRPVRTAEGLKHPAFRFASADQQNEEIWSSLPAFQWFYPVLRIKPGAEVLLEHPTARGEDRAAPLAVQAWYGGGRVFFSALDSTWRWRKETGDRYFYRYWGQLIRWAAQERLLGGSRLWLSSDLSEYRRGATAALLARALDREMKPVADETLLARVTAPDGSTTEVSLRREESRGAMYRGTLEPYIPGEYKVVIERDGLTAERTFEVRHISPESLTLRLDSELLARVAAESGGEVLPLSAIGTAIELVKARQTESLEFRHESLLDAPLLYLLFIFLLGAEWVIRRFLRLL